MESSSSGPVEPLDGHINSTFSEISIIAEKGYNTIYKAKRYGQWYVLKGLSAVNQGNQVYAGLLEKEFSLSVQVNHPNIAHAYSFEKVDGIGDCIVMEYVDGVTLDKYIKAATDEERIRIVSQILSAMEYYQSLQIVHRDLKPSNILVTRNGGNVKIIDFGLSDSDSYAIFKQPAGSAKYMAPEQYDSKTPIDLRADIYSVGVIMKEILPSRYKSVIEICIRKDREERYHTATEVKRAISAQNQRRRNIIRATAAAGIVCAIIIGNWGLIKHLTTNNEKVMVNRVDTVTKEVAPAISQTIRDTIIVEKTIPLRVDTIVKIKEIVPPEYVEIINKEKEEQQRKDRVKVETEKIFKYIDKECAEYEKERESGRPEYLYQPQMMAAIKHSDILLSKFDDIIELEFTIEEYYRIFRYADDNLSKHLNSPEYEPRTNDEKIQMVAIGDSLSAIMHKQVDALNSKMGLLSNNQLKRHWKEYSKKE